MGFASGGGSKRDDEGSSGAERGGFGGWGGGRNEHGASKGDERSDKDFGGTNAPAQSESSQEARRSVNPNTEVEETRSFLSRVRDIFSDEEEEGDQITDQHGNVVAESFAIDPPAEIQTVELGDKTAYETIDSPNPYESYARSVIDDGLVGDEQKEKDLAKDIADAGRTAQGIDVASTLAGTFAGPIGAVPGLAYDAITDLQDDPIQQAGKALYEGSKVNTPGLSTAIGGAFGPLASGAFDIANDVFGGSRDLGSFEEAAGVQRDPQSRRPSNDFDGGGNRSTSNATQSLAQPPATLASTFSQSSLGTNVYSDFLDNFFKQG